MYPKKVVERIKQLEAKGFSPEETRKVLLEENGKAPCIDRIYKLRHGQLAAEITEEEIRQQRRRILKQEEANPKLAMHYSNELLKMLIPQRIESRSEIDIKQKVIQLHLWRPGDEPNNNSPNDVPAIRQTSSLPQRPLQNPP